MKGLVALIIVIGLLAPSTAVSDTIYKWTDDEGVTRFSNDPPPENIEKFETLQPRTSQPNTQVPGNERRSSYDQMIEESMQESKELEQQRRMEAQRQAAEKKRMAEARRNEETAAQRQRLQQEIEALKNRALGPTYSQGMKEAQIDKIKKQIEQLESNPDDVKPRKEVAIPPSKSSY